MSAIFGRFNLDGKPVDPNDVERMRTALADLGPEGGVVWIEGAISLGHLLMCFTPEDRLEQQPMFAPDRQLVLVCDARLDNRTELAELLHISGAARVEMPDSAFILRAYERWGMDCAHHLIGEFAFAVWDARQRQLMAARSPLGERTFFYHASRAGLAFATMPRCLHALAEIPRRPDEETIARFLATSWQGPAGSFYRDIQRLPPGYQLVADAQGVRVQQYWQLASPRPHQFTKAEDTVEAFTALFERVVADQLRSLTPVAVAVSGGLDSSSVAALAAVQLQRGGQRLAAFTEVPRAGFTGPLPNGRYADETPFVQALARRYPAMDLNLVQTGDNSPLENLDAYFATVEMPTAPLSNRVWWEEILRQARQQGIRVLLTGDQGNLTVSWAGSGLLAQLMRRGQWWRAVQEAHAAARRGATRSAWGTLLTNGILPLLPAPLVAAVAGVQGWVQPQPPGMDTTLLNPDFAAAYGFGSSSSPTAEVRDRGHLREKRLSLLTRLDILGINATGYRARYGVETRSPLVDVRLVEFCLNLPEEEYRSDGETRRLIRRAMAGRLPPEILHNTRRGLQAADWLERVRRHGDELEAELARFERSEPARRILNLTAIRQLLDRVLHSDAADSPHLLAARMVFDRGFMMGRFLCSF